MLTLCLSQSSQSQNWPGNELTNKARENIFILCRISNENVVKSDVGAWFLFLSVGDIFFDSKYIGPLWISSTSSLGLRERALVTRLRYRLLLRQRCVFASTNSSDCARICNRKPFWRVHCHWNCVASNSRPFVLVAVLQCVPWPCPRSPQSLSFKASLRAKFLLKELVLTSI